MEIRIKQGLYDVLLPVKNISDIDTTCEDGDHGSIWEVHLADPDEGVLSVWGGEIAQLKELLPQLVDFMPVHDGDYWVNVKHCVQDEIDDSDPESWTVPFMSGNGFTLEDDDLENFVRLTGLGEPIPA